MEDSVALLEEPPTMELDQQQPELALELASEPLKVKHRMSQVRKQIQARVIVQHYRCFRVKLLPENSKISVHFIVLFITLTLTLILTKYIFTKRETEGRKQFSDQLTEPSCILQLDLKHLHGSCDHHLAGASPTPCQHLPPQG